MKSRNVVESDRTHDIIIQRMRLVCWITKINTCRIYCVIITRFSRHQCLRERDSTVRYTHVACFVIHFKIYPLLLYRKKYMAQTPTDAVAFSCLSVCSELGLFPVSQTREVHCQINSCFSCSGPVIRPIIRLQ